MKMKTNYERHVKSCKIYHKFMEKTAYGFQCLVCNKEITSSRSRVHMYQHLMKIHHILETSKDLIEKDKEFVKKSLNSNNMELRGELKSCIYCSMKMSTNYERHIKSCKIYHKFIKKTDYGFQCLVCNQENNQRNNMYAHIRKEHLKQKEKNS